MLPGVVGDPGRPEGAERRAMAALLYAGQGAVISHESAAYLWKLRSSTTREVTVTVPANRSRHQTPGVIVHRSRSLPSFDWVLMGKLTVTSAPRTIFDLCEVLGSKEVAELVDDAILDGIVTVGQLSLAVKRHERRDRRGIVAVRSALGAWVGDGKPESHAETEVTRWLVARRLGPHVRQHVVRGERAVRLDFAWPEHRIALEVDGFRYHDGPRQFREDRARSNWLAAQGWIVLRTTVAEVRSGGADLERALRRLLACGREP
ncbi:MAG: DUF559 domain-containing protein [Acidimicrobiales bacterium]